MSVPQYTTPTFTLTFSEQTLDLTQADNVYVTFSSGPYKLTKTGSDITVGEKTINVFLSQDETGHFFPGDVRIQANWTSFGNKRFASEIVTYNISDQLLKRVVE